MKNIFPFLLLNLILNWVHAQSYYFPPLTGDNWETISPSTLDWPADSIQTLLTFLEQKNTKAFIVLKDGRIAIEHYFGNFTQDTPWYWASSGKSLAAFLVGQAQEEGLLHIDSATSNYLGKGWTVSPPEKERLITVKHQLTMTTGLDDQVQDLNCLNPECLDYMTDPETRWAYHNAPYRLVQEVVANASGMSFQEFTNTRLGSTIGLRGLWVNYVFWSKARMMARFGLLMLNRGVWDTDTVLKDQTYIQRMTTSSQSLNPSYGYLWWLNGKGMYMLPRIQFLFGTDLIPPAPSDMFAALGKNDQKIYVVPSMDLVVIRMGDDAGDNNFAASSFDTQLWERLMNIFNRTTHISITPQSSGIKIHPNPTSTHLEFQLDNSITYFPQKIAIIDMKGKEVMTTPFQKNIQLPHLSSGLFFVNMMYANGQSRQYKLMIK